MTKYSGKNAATSTRARTAPSAPISTTVERAYTYNGDLGYVRDAKSELFVLAVNFMGEQENTFYETGDSRQERFVGLIRKVTQDDPAWMQAFIPFLRDEAFMRTASVVALVEYARAGGPDADMLIARTLRRADEPAELLGYYWATNGGRKTIAEQIKRGLSFSADKLYNEFNALKYDGVSHGIRFGDVIELTHPKLGSRKAEQSQLFRYLLDRRHHPDNIRAEVALLPQIAANRDLRQLATADRRNWLRKNGNDGLKAAGMTWESLSEWLPGGMDSEAWEAMIPSMGYMALLRNLRNFDEAGVSDVVAGQVIERLTDPEQVAKSMQFPYRFYSAYSNTNSLRWAAGLEKALDLSVQNIPKLAGRSLVLIDVSGSMTAPMSNKSQIQMCVAAALFGVAQFRAAGFSGDIVQFGQDNKNLRMEKGWSVLKGTAYASTNHDVGHSTNLWPALRDNYNGHDRVFIFTDMQANNFTGTGGYGYSGYSEGSAAVLKQVKGPVYFWNLAGYRPSAAETGADGVYEMAGLSDVTFRQIALLEASKSAGWPWE